MQKIRASYSLLHNWEQGRINEALMSYFHMPHETPKNYVNGKRWDEYCQKYITDEAKMPPEWGGDELNEPVVQLKLSVPYNELCSLTAVYDVYTRSTETLYELKSGHSMSANQYAATHQVPIYFLAAKLSNIPIKQGKVIRYNPVTNTQDRALLYNGDRLINKARNYLDSLVPEIHKYFEDHDLFNKADEDMLKLLSNS